MADPEKRPSIEAELWWAAVTEAGHKRIPVKLYISEALKDRVDSDRETRERTGRTDDDDLPDQLGHVPPALAPEGYESP